MSANDQSEETTKSPNEATHYIVVDNAIGLSSGGAVRGDVLHRDAYGDQFDRFLHLNSIRAATQAEARMSHVTLPSEPTRDFSFEGKLQAANETIGQLQQVNRQQAERINQLLVEIQATEAARVSAVTEMQRVKSDMERARLNPSFTGPTETDEKPVKPVQTENVTGLSGASTGAGSEQTGRTDEEHEAHPMTKPLALDFPARTDLMVFYGDNITPEGVDALTDEELDAVPNIGPPTVTKIRGYIEKLKTD